ncbi:putative bifunctional diguanylate cyclase/phosphodiesterase, partial [Kineococcus glutinatus]|uniref:putative bifunctional diguanylate cyclase/phosphodiesterase n=1 Tax=Kineococcus glutinatus TaxID=1070872 RepID=UPI0031EED3CC
MGDDLRGAVVAAVVEAVWADGEPWVACRAVRDGAGDVVDLEYVLANDAAQALVGMGPLVGRRMLELLPQVREGVFAHLRRAVEDGGARTVRLPTLAATDPSAWTGTWTWMELRAAGDVLVVHWRDATAEHELAEASRRSERRLAALVEHASDVVSVVGADRTVTYVTPAVERVLGRSVLGEDLLASARPDAVAAAAAALDALTAGPPGAAVELELPLRHADGRWVDVAVRATNHLADPAVAGIVVNWRDVTEERALAERLRQEALHDPLTGLPNRRLFDEELERALACTERDGTGLGVVFCDLDHFKAVNDGLGHPVGDELLRAVAARLRGSVRPSDVVARIGGDEFVVLAVGLTPQAGSEELSALAGRIRAAVRGEYRLGPREVVLTATLGAAAGTWPRAAADVLADADAALYEAKRSGRDRVEVFDDGMHRRAAERLDLGAALRRALGGGELQVHYQPQVDVVTGRTSGAEALLRWVHPERGVLPAGQFLPMAEESGLMVDVGAWVLTAAMTGAAGWRGEQGPPPRVTINLSRRQLAHPGLLDDIEAALEVSGIEPPRVEFEVTEQVVLGDVRTSERVLPAVRARGFGIALDDFGTGYSSLTWLQRLPVDTVKLDRSVIEPLAAEAGSAAATDGRRTVGAVTTFAHALGRTVTAEGVETAQQHRALRDLGCDSAQGFLYGRPAAVLTAAGVPA